MLAALCDEDMVVCMHIGGAFGLIQQPENAPADHIILLAPQLSALTTNDLVISGVFRRFPGLKVALSEGGIGWIPFYLDRLDRHVDNQRWTGLDIDGKGSQPTEMFREHFLGCFITDPSSLRLLDRIGEDVVAWECDYPHSDSTWPDSPEMLLGECEGAGLTDAQIDKISYQNACRFFRFDPFAHVPKEHATVRGAAGARHRRRHHRDVEVGVPPPLRPRRGPMRHPWDRRLGVWWIAEDHPDQPAIVASPSGVTLTFGELAGRAHQLVRALDAHGIGRGDIVAYALPNDVDIVVWQLAAMEAGIRSIALSPALSARGSPHDRRPLGVGGGRGARKLERRRRGAGLGAVATTPRVRRQPSRRIGRRLHPPGRTGRRARHRTARGTLARRCDLVLVGDDRHAQGDLAADPRRRPVGCRRQHEAVRRARSSSCRSRASTSCRPACTTAAARASTTAR